jgi:hypothetical protein
MIEDLYCLFVTFRSLPTYCGHILTLRSRCRELYLVSNYKLSPAKAAKFESRSSLVSEF